MSISSYIRIAIPAICLWYALSAYGQNSVVVIPMFESETIYTGVSKTGDSKCSLYLSSPGNWQERDCASLPSELQGQDGQLQLGAESAPRYTDRLDGTIADNLTGLVWLKHAFCAGELAGHTWSEALGFIAELNASGTMNGNDCGDISNSGVQQVDWHLPNVRELQTLLDYGQADSPYLSGSHPFLNVQLGEAYWSSTNYGFVWDADLGVNLIDDALRVNFDNAVTDGTGKNGMQHVWAVRNED